MSSYKPKTFAAGLPILSILCQTPYQNLQVSKVSNQELEPEINQAKSAYTVL